MNKKNVISDHVLPMSMNWHVLLLRVTCGTSDINGNVAVSQYKIFVMIRKEAPRVIRPHIVQI